MEALLEISGLNIQFSQAGRPQNQGKGKAPALKAVRNISLSVYPNEVLGLVGESGSGKSITALSVLRLLPTPPAQVSGSIRFFPQKNQQAEKSATGVELLSLPVKELYKHRGADIGMIFQEPMTALNPVFKIKTQMVEALRQHQPQLSAREALESCIAMLEQVGIPNGRRRVEEYPHQYSGGMRQRIVIAMALINKPTLLIADEPTTALDVSIQAQILDLMMELQSQRSGSAILLITHDMAVIAQTCQRVAVMYGGQIQELAPVRQIFANACHPYTQGLLQSIPTFTSSSSGAKRLLSIPGTVPNLADMPQGCPFSSRCCAEYSKQNPTHCKDTAPDFYQVEPGHHVRCHAYANANCGGLA